MRPRTLVWTLAVFAAVLVLVPLVSMLAMAGAPMGGGMMGMTGMHVSGFVWFILTIVVIAGLVALLVRGETKA